MISLFCLAIFYLIPGFIGWPGLHIDSYYYATPVISAARGKGWLFGAFPHLLALYPDRVYRGHGFIHIVFFGELLRCATWSQFLFWCSVVNATSCVVWGVGCLRQLKLESRWLEILAALVTANIAGLAALTLQGRPEHLAVMLSGIMLLVVQSLGRCALVDLAVACSTGILFCMSPALGALMACGVAVFCGVFWSHEKTPKRFLRFAFIGSVALLVSGILIWLAGFSISFWLSSNLMSLETYFPLYCVFHIGKFWSGDTSFFFPLWNALFCLAGGAVVFELFKKHCWWELFWLAGVGVRLTPFLLDYSYYAFLPGMFVLLMRSGVMHGGKWIAIYRPFVYCCFAGLVCVYSVTTVRLATLIALYICCGFTIEQARMEVQGLRQQIEGHGDLIAFSGRRNASPIVLEDPSSEYLQCSPTRAPGPSHMAEVERIEAIKGSKIRFFLYAQTYRGNPPDEVYLGETLFQLQKHNWTVDRTKFLGLPLGGAFPGYQFAIYQRSENAGSAQELKERR